MGKTFLARGFLLNMHEGPAVDVVTEEIEETAMVAAAVVVVAALEIGDQPGWTTDMVHQFVLNTDSLWRTCHQELVGRI
jgi:hypothetical protein